MPEPTPTTSDPSPSVPESSPTAAAAPTPTPTEATETTGRPPFEEIAARLDAVEGWLTLDQARALYDAARPLQPGQRIVEIGSFRGRSTTVLGLAAAPGVEIIAIDPHAGNDRGPNELDGFAAEAAGDHEVFRANLERAGLTGRVRHLRAFSNDALGEVDGPIDVLFIDGAHRYRPARDDIVQWGELVAPGGALLIHDAFSSVGVTLAIGRALLWSGRFRYAGRAGSLASYRAEPTATPAGRVANAARQLAQLPWFARNVAIKVLIMSGLGRATRFLGHTEPTWPY
jgi:predicted O-methyltransferase YrrM